MKLLFLSSSSPSSSPFSSSSSLSPSLSSASSWTKFLPVRALVRRLAKTALPPDNLSPLVRSSSLISTTVRSLISLMDNWLLMKFAAKFGPISNASNDKKRIATKNKSNSWRFSIGCGLFLWAKACSMFLVIIFRRLCCFRWIHCFKAFRFFTLFRSFHRFQLKDVIFVVISVFLIFF